MKLMGITLCSVTVLSALSLAQAEATALVVGVTEPHVGVFSAVRGTVPAGTIVTGIRFYSNDATIFPQVVLASDVGDMPLPQVGAPLRTLPLIEGQAGYVTVEFPAYEATEGQFLWAIVHFPDLEPLTAAGVGGGPGIGWREETVLETERSLYSVAGVMQEFKPAFDISLVTGISKVASLGTEQEAERAVPLTLMVQPIPSTRSSAGTRFKLGLPRSGAVRLDIYDVAGRHVARPLDRALPAGVHEIAWAGRGLRGHRVAAGIYLYRFLLGREQQAGKVLVVR